MVPSNHAIKRAKERLSWNANTLNRMLKKAMSNGIARKNTTGQLRKFLDSKCIPNKSNAFVYGDVAYFYKGETLATIYQIPKELNKVVKKQKKVRAKPVSVHAISSEPLNIQDKVSDSLFDKVFSFLQLRVGIFSVKESVGRKL